MTPGAIRSGWTGRRAQIALLAAVFVAVLVMGLLAPEGPDSSATGSRSTHLKGPQGAAIAYGLASRLGWHVSQRETPFDSIPSPNAIQALLAPPEPLSQDEVHRVLEGVRRGGALLLAGEVEGLADSLHYTVSEADLTYPLARDQSSCGHTPGTTLLLYSLVFPPSQDLVWMAPHPPNLIGWPANPHDDPRAAERLSLGMFPLGAGRVAIIPASSMLSNQVIQICHWGTDTTFVRALEYLSGGEVDRHAIVFDEYHHGYGTHPGAFRAIGLFVRASPLGRALIVLTIGGLFLIAAGAPRGVPPVDPVRIVRRSPLEQADALAAAYTAVGGTRTATMKLLSGVRRRTSRAQGYPVLTDQEFLESVAHGYPALAVDADKVKQALLTPVPAEELSLVGAALDRIERGLSSSSYLSHPIA